MSSIRGVADEELRSRLGADPDDCLVLYAGTHGISQGLTSVVDAAARLADKPIRFAFVGEGADKRRVQNRVAELGLRNVALFPSVPHDQVPALLAAVDICLIPLRDIPLFSSFIPSKIFECLAVGRPVVGAVTGEAAQILREAGAQVVPPEDSTALADAIETLAADPQRRETMGREGRSYVEKYFDRRTLAPSTASLSVHPVGPYEAPGGRMAAVSAAITPVGRDRRHDRHGPRHAQPHSGASAAGPGGLPCTTADSAGSPAPVS